MMDKQLKIYALGNIDDYLDEAQKNITKRIISELSKKCEIRYENAKENLLKLKFWKNIRAFRPDIIHIFLRPTVSVLLYAGIFRVLWPNTKIVISAFQPPKIPVGLTQILSLFKPDLFVTISERLSSELSAIGSKTTVLKCGVDVDKFMPVGKDIKSVVRKKYNVPLEKHIVIHVGHATEGRNLKILKNLADDHIAVVFVTSKSYNLRKSLIEDLKRRDCMVVGDYTQNIQELYQMSDCYVFPTLNESYAISLPLSVLEAMSCNIPVVSTKFGALPDLFGEDDSLVFFDGTAEDLQFKVRKMVNGKTITSNREKVLEFDWKIVGRKLEGIYHKLLNGKL